MTQNGRPCTKSWTRGFAPVAQKGGLRHISDDEAMAIALRIAEKDYDAGIEFLDTWSPDRLYMIH